MRRQLDRGRSDYGGVKSIVAMTVRNPFFLNPTALGATATYKVV
jgi:hypothetical protein